ncbi:MAG TPA: hypothetical protein VFV08_04485, partial [Puia sp.]|nr:hypothetical protein [Puia sp.]
MQKNRKSILCTAPVREEMIQLADAKDIRLEIIPFIEVRAISDKTVSDKIQALARQEHIVIFTSIRALEYVL